MIYILPELAAFHREKFNIPSRRPFSHKRQSEAHADSLAVDSSSSIHTVEEVMRQERKVHLGAIRLAAKNGIFFENDSSNTSSPFDADLRKRNISQGTFTWVIKQATLFMLA